MVSELVPEAAIWATVSSWFTPTVLFVVLNIVIGTIAIRSKLSNSSQPDDGSRIEGGVFDLSHDYQPRLLSRGSSIVARLKSMNLHRHVSSAFAPPTTETLQPPPPADAVTTSHRKEEVQEEVEVDRFDSDSNSGSNSDSNSDSNSEVFETMEEAYMAARRGSTDYRRSRSEMDSLPLQKKVVMQELRKSATATATAAATATEKVKVMVKAKAKAKAKETREEEDEVDARADDFINRFKKQLQLQRLESLDRLKKMINRGTGK